MTARARCALGVLLVCITLGLGACSDGGRPSDWAGMLTRAAVLLERSKQDMDHHGHARIFHHTISAPRARVVHIQEGLRWWALVGWAVLLLLVVAICVGMSRDLPGGLSNKQRVACGLGVAALCAIPIVDVAFKRGLWVIDAEQRTMTCDRTGPIGLFDSRDTRTLPETPVMLASFSEHRSERVDEDGHATVSTTMSSMLYVKTGDSERYLVWHKTGALFKDEGWGLRAHTVAACLLIAGLLEGACGGEDSPTPNAGTPSSPTRRATEPTDEPLLNTPAQTP